MKENRRLSRRRSSLAILFDRITGKFDKTAGAVKVIDDFLKEKQINPPPEHAKTYQEYSSQMYSDFLYQRTNDRNMAFINAELNGTSVYDIPEVKEKMTNISSKSNIALNNDTNLYHENTLLTKSDNLTFPYSEQKEQETTNIDTYIKKTEIVNSIQEEGEAKDKTIVEAKAQDIKPKTLTTFSPPQQQQQQQQQQQNEKKLNRRASTSLLPLLTKSITQPMPCSLNSEEDNLPPLKPLNTVRIHNRRNSEGNIIKIRIPAGRENLRKYQSMFNILEKSSNNQTSRSLP